MRAAGGAALLIGEISSRASASARAAMPLFVEELTDPSLDSAAAAPWATARFADFAERRCWRAPRPARPRCEESFAQVAAVIGREFGGGAAARGSRKPAGAWPSSWDGWSRRRIVLSASAAPDGYAFRHALHRDAASINRCC